MEPLHATEPAGLYIHIPFCLKKCHYCDFYSSTRLQFMDAYVDGLLDEMEIYRGRFETFDTVYIGGGTPSLLSSPLLTRIFEGIGRNFTIAEDPEITIEANPGDVTPSRLECLAGLGVNRIHIGVQSFDDDILSFLGRRHTAEDARRALDMAHNAGFASVGADLMYGVPGQDSVRWQQSLEGVISYHVDHVSCYQLTIEKGTLLESRLIAGEFALPEGVVLEDLFFLTASVLKDHGYLQYEVSNYAKTPAMRSRHNQKYWRHVPYLGLGPSAHSFIKRNRWANCRSLTAYIEAIQGGCPPVERSETLTDDEMLLEALCLGFRTAAGIDPEALRLRYGYDIMGEKRDKIDMLLAEQFMVFEKGRLRPTTKGLAIADSLALI